MLKQYATVALTPLVCNYENLTDMQSEPKSDRAEAW